MFKTALLTLIAALVAQPAAPAAAVPVAPRSLPHALWAVEAGRPAMPLLTAARLSSLARSPVNALVVRPGRLSQAKLQRLRSRLPSKLSLYVPLRERASAAATVTACRTLKLRAPGSRCAVWARSPTSALALARTRIVDVVFVRTAVGGIGAFLGAPERVVAVPVLSGRPGRDWRAAISTADTSPAVDLGGAPEGRGGLLSAYVRMLRRLVPRTDRTPPAAPRALEVQRARATKITLDWRRPSGGVSFGVYRNGKRLAATRKTALTVSGLSCGRRYLFEVDALDRAGNRSAKAAVRASTKRCSSVYTLRADLYVSPSGSDAGRCSRSAPCRSFNRAYHVAKPGDVIEASGGSYRTQAITAKRGAEPPAVIIREAVGERAVVGDPGATINCIAFEGASHLLVAGFETPYVDVAGEPSQCGISIGRDGTHHVTVLDLDVGGVWVGATDVKVQSSDIGPNVNQGGTPTAISSAENGDSERILFEGNVFHDYTSVGGNHQQCFAAWSGQGVTLRGNRFSNCETFHLWLVAESGWTISDYLIENNTFTQPDASIGISSTVKVGDHGGALENIVLRGNRVHTDELYVVQGFDGGGTGDIHLLGNRTDEPISLGSGDDCMADATYSPRAGVVYECQGNRLLAAPRATALGTTPHREPPR